MIICQFPGTEPTGTKRPCQSLFLISQRSLQLMPDLNAKTYNLHQQKSKIAHPFNVADTDPCYFWPPGSAS
jgi:hypothetical protein